MFLTEGMLPNWPVDAFNMTIILIVVRLWTFAGYWLGSGACSELMMLYLWSFNCPLIGLVSSGVLGSDCKERYSILQVFIYEIRTPKIRFSAHGSCDLEIWAYFYPLRRYPNVRTAKIRFIAQNKAMTRNPIFVHAEKLSWMQDSQGLIQCPKEAVSRQSGNLSIR